MKKAMKQSTLTQLMNMGTIALMVLSITLAVVTTVKNHNIDTANANRFNLTSNANRFMDASAYLTSEVRAFAATGNMTHYNNYWDEVNNRKNRETGVSEMQAIGLTPAEQNLIDQMSSLSNNLVPLESAAMDQVQAGETARAIEAVFGPSYEETTTKSEA